MVWEEVDKLIIYLLLDLPDRFVLYKKAVKGNKVLAKGLNVIDGKVTYKPVAKVFNLKYYPVEEIIINNLSIIYQ